MLLAVAALMIPSCKMFDNTVGNKAEVPTGPVRVKVIPVTVGESVNSVCYVGTVEPSRQVTLSTPSSGTLSQLSVTKGGYVHQGQVIAKVESQSVRSAYDMAVSKLAQAEDAYERIQKVNATGSVPPVKIVEIETALAQAKAMKEAAERSLSQCTIRAPFPGTVEDVYVERGVELSIAAPVVKIVDISKIEIRFSIPENEIAGIAIGDKARVEIPALSKETTATVSSKGVVASMLSHSYDCSLGRIADQSGLMPGMVCKVFLERGGMGGIVLPATCVMTDMDGRYVWTVTDGVVGKKHVEIGGYSGDGIVISSGLENVQYVVVEGARKVSTGMSVETFE